MPSKNVAVLQLKELENMLLQKIITLQILGFATEKESTHLKPLIPKPQIKITN
jgi:hypothetical protein